MGRMLANNLKVEVGEEIVLYGQGRDGSLATTAVEVVGIFETGSKDIDLSMLHIPLDAFREVFSMQKEAHALVVSARSLEIVEKQREEIAQLLGDREKITVLSWDEVVPGLKEAIEMDIAFGYIFYLSW